MNAERPVVGFAAWSGTGKTTLLRRLLPLFASRGLRIGVIKHAHHEFEIDHPGKDSYELRKAGAAQMLVASRRRWALIVETPDGDDPDLPALVARLHPETLDLVLVEGFKPEAVPKIELHRPVLGRPLLAPDDSTIVAVATDAPLARAVDVPVLDLNDPPAIAAFVIERFLGRKSGSQ